MRELWTSERVNALIGEELDKIKVLLTARGADYGPNILKQLGLQYPILLIIAKALRLQWYWKQHGEPHWDSVQDLVGYGILALVQRRLEEMEQQQKREQLVKPAKLEE